MLSSPLKFINFSNSQKSSLFMKINILHVGLRIASEKRVSHLKQHMHKGTRIGHASHLKQIVQANNQLTFFKRRYKNVASILHRYIIGTLLASKSLQTILLLNGMVNLLNWGLTIKQDFIVTTIYRKVIQNVFSFYPLNTYQKIIF